MCQYLIIIQVKQKKQQILPLEEQKPKNVQSFEFENLLKCIIYYQKIAGKIIDVVNWLID